MPALALIFHPPIPLFRPMPAANHLTFPSFCIFFPALQEPTIALAQLDWRQQMRKAVDAFDADV